MSRLFHNLGGIEFLYLGGEKMKKGMEKNVELDLFAEELSEQMDAAVVYGCLGTAGTLGSATGTAGTFGTYGCY